MNDTTKGKWALIMGAQGGGFDITLKIDGQDFAYPDGPLELEEALGCIFSLQEDSQMFNIPEDHIVIDKQGVMDNSKQSVLCRRLIRKGMIA
jgi:hypothetical protein